MATGPITVHVGRTVNVVADSQEDLSKLLDSLEILVARIGVIVRIGDEFAKIHPYANAAWQIVTAVYKAVETQQETDENLVGLIAAMVDVYSFAEDIESLHNKMKGLGDILIKILNQTVECGIYIREHTTSGFYCAHFYSLLLSNQLTFITR
ncbi:hypothetical protein K438DRAFT_1608964 [Mycena galopus ATCC 62051]|nr:hypothetical protein K438DRAFT_1608964 [Mycena galopus ATCC 62051]